jgi:hypothetical protein
LRGACWIGAPRTKPRGTACLETALYECCMLMFFVFYFICNKHVKSPYSLFGKSFLRLVVQTHTSSVEEYHMLEHLYTSTSCLLEKNSKEKKLSDAQL